MSLLTVVVLWMSFHICVCTKVYDMTSSTKLFEGFEASLAMRTNDRPLVYLFSSSHAQDIVTLVTKSSLHVTEKDFYCFDLASPGDDILNELDVVAVARSRSSSLFTFLLVTGVESLHGEKEVGKLNFLHQVTDANSVYANLIVILIWDTSTHVIPADANVEDYVLDFFGKGGAKMNPSALYGRLSTIALGAASNFNPLKLNFPCQPHEDAITHEQGDESGEGVVGTLTVAVVVMVVVTFSLMIGCRSGSQVASTYTTLAPSNSQCVPQTTPTKDRASKSDTPRRSQRIRKAKKNSK